MTHPEIQNLVNLLPVTSAPLASAFMSTGNLYCVVPDADRREFVAAAPAAQLDADLQAFVIPSDHQQAPAAQNWISQKNTFGSTRELMAGSCKPAFGSIHQVEGTRPFGMLEHIRGIVYRSVWHMNDKTVLLPANAPEALLFARITGEHNDLYLSSLEANLTAFWDTLQSIRSWTRKDGLPELSRLANGAVSLLKGWYHFKQEQLIVELVQEAVRELSGSLSAVRKSNAMIVDAYGNEAFEFADIFDFFRSRNF